MVIRDIRFDSLLLYFTAKALPGVGCLLPAQSGVVRGFNSGEKVAEHGSLADVITLGGSQQGDSAGPVVADEPTQVRQGRRWLGRCEFRTVSPLELFETRWVVSVPGTQLS